MRGKVSSRNTAAHGAPVATTPTRRTLGRVVMPLARPSGSRHEPPVLDPVRALRLRAEPLAPVRLVVLVVALEPDDAAVALEGEDVGRDTIEEPAVVADHDRAAGEVDEPILQ